MTSSAAPRPVGRRPRALARAGAAVIAALAVAVGTAALPAAPAHADPVNLVGVVVDQLGDPVASADVTVLEAPGDVVPVDTTTTDPDGAFALSLDTGSYHLRFAKAGYATTFYLDGVTATIDIDAEGAITVDGAPVVDGDLGTTMVESTATHALTGTVQDAGSSPLEGIEVTAHPFGAGTVAATDTTDGSGHYELDLAAGSYEIAYSDPGATYIATSYGGDTPTELTVRASGALEADGSPTGCPSLCAVVMATPPPAAEFPIAGSVVDANGDPVNGITVSVDPTGASSDSGSDTTKSVLGEDGRYSVSVLPGTYHVVFSGTGFVTRSYRAPGSGTDAVVTVAANGDLSVPGNSLTGNELDPTDLRSTARSVTGKVVVSGSATGIPGITVRAHSSTADENIDATAGVGGSYTLSLPIGTYEVELLDLDGTAPQYVGTWLGGDTHGTVVVGQGSSLTYDGSPVATLPDGPMVEAADNTTYAVSGSVVDANGDPIEGATVTGTPQATGTADTDSTVADGSWTLQLTKGTYRIGFAATGFVGATYPGGAVAQDVVVAPGGAVTVGGQPVPGGALDQVTLASDADQALAGSVEDVGTDPIAGITVDVFPAGDFSGSAVATTTSDVAGAWSFTGLQIGSYSVRLTDSDGTAPQYVQTYVGGASADLASTITLGQGGAVSVDGGSIPGHTLDPVTMVIAGADTTYPVTGDLVDANGDPIVGATVTALVQGGSGTQATDTTDVDGIYTVEVKAGTYRLSHAATGFTTATYPGPGQAPLNVVVQIGGSITVGGQPYAGVLDQVSLESAADHQLAGTVETGAGAPINGITVDVFPAGDFAADSKVATTTTSGSGAWSFTTLRIGTYSLRFTDSDGNAPQYVQTYFGGASAELASQVKLGQGGAVSVDDVAINGHTLDAVAMAVADDNTTYPVTGSVYDVNGDPIVGATVTGVVQGGLGTQDTDTSDPDGVFTLQLKAGTYRVTYAATGFAGATYPGPGSTAVDVVVASGGAITVGGDPYAGALDPVSLDGTTSYPLAGSATNGDGDPLAGITVDVFPAGDFFPDSRVATTTTDVAGEWSVDTLKIGTYSVRFTDNDDTDPVYVQTYVGGATAETASAVKIGQGGDVGVDDVPIDGHTLDPVALEAADVNTAYAVEGDVYDVNFDGIVDVLVTATPQNGNGTLASTTSDNDGHYSLQLVAGTYRLGFSASGFASTKYPENDNPLNVVVLPGGVIKVSGDEVPGGLLDSVVMTGTTPFSLAGVVTDGTDGLDGITVSAASVDAPNTVVASDTTSGGGTYDVSVPVGTYLLTFSDPGAGYQVAYYPEDVKVDQHGELFGEDGSPLDGLADVVMTAVDPDATYELAGTVYDEVYEPLDGVTVSVLPAGDPDAAPVATGETGADPGDTPLGDHGVYRVAVPPGSYWLRYEEGGHQAAYLLKYNGTTATVVVTPDGTITAPGTDTNAGVIADVQLLLPAPTMLTAPKIKGKVVVGSTIQTSFGTYEGMTVDKDYVYVEWFLDGKDASEFSSGYSSEKFKVTAAAATKVLTYRVTVTDPDDVDYLRAAAVYDSTPVTVPLAPATLAASYQKKALKITVTVPTLSSPPGKITVKDGSKVVGTVKLTKKSKGKVTLKLKLSPGKHKLTITYAGGATITTAKKTLTVKV